MQQSFNDKHSYTGLCRDNFTCIFFSTARQPLGGLGRLIFRGFTITLFRHTTLGRTPLEEWSARRRDLYLTTHNTHKRQTRIETHNPSKRAAVDPRLRPRGHWDRLASPVYMTTKQTKEVSFISLRNIDASFIKNERYTHLLVNVWVNILPSAEEM
jgi:hypothetical protein